MIYSAHTILLNQIWLKIIIFEPNQYYSNISSVGIQLNTLNNNSYKVSYSQIYLMNKLIKNKLRVSFHIKIMLRKVLHNNYDKVFT